MTEMAVVLPPGVDPGPSRGRLPDGQPVGGRGMIVNETDLPDEILETYIEEHASVLGVNLGSTFQTYANQGSLLTRAKFQVPRTNADEIRLARDIAERDDDVGATLGMMVATAFGEGMRHSHPDEVTTALFDELAKHMNLDAVLTEVYRELLIASQVTTVHLFTAEQIQFLPRGADRQRTRGIIAPRVGVLPAEQIRVLDNDMFGTGTLAYLPINGSQDMFLRELFSDQTSPAKQAELRRKDPVLATLLIRQVRNNEPDRGSWQSDVIDPPSAEFLYVLNPRMVSRSTFPKGATKYPRPLLTRNFALLEAKRMLNIMDYALLQGGANFLVVAKKGSDQKPALPAEISGLRETMRRSSHAGVIIGDHRLSIEIITPKLDELLNAEKRNLLGKKIASGLLRLPGFTEAASGAGEAVKADSEIISRVITSDRRLIRRHIENSCYEETVDRNTASFEQGQPSIWFPKIMLQGLQYFTDMVLKLRDRGDISRSSTVAVAGFDYQTEVASRKAEKGDDRTMTPAAVPFSQPGQPSDNGGGRPPGGSSANGAPGSAPGRTTQDHARPSQVIQRVAGETVRAMFEDEIGAYRIGELTYRLLEEFADYTEGRLTSNERRALDVMARAEWPEEPIIEGTITVVPVNPEHEMDQVRAVRLRDGMSVLIGRGPDDAVLARALCFRSPDFSPVDAEEHAMRLGFLRPASLVEPDPEPDPEPAE